jgi:hypothetical protein
MKKPKSPPRLPAKTLHDLACSNCGQINRQDYPVSSTFAFCPRCQENTQHYAQTVKTVGIEFIPRSKKDKKRRSEYSPKGKKKMGFTGATKKKAK